MSTVSDRTRRSGPAAPRPDGGDRGPQRHRALRRARRAQRREPRRSPRPTIVGLVGPNGAGKTTLFGVVSGLLRPQAGDVFLGGRQGHRRHAVEARDSGSRADVPAARAVHGPHGARARGARVPGPQPTQPAVDRPVHRRCAAPRRDDEKQRVDHLVDLLGLTSVANTGASSLPLGTARRVEVARALATGPSIVLLDEPSSGLDGPRDLATRRRAAHRRRRGDVSRCCSSSTTSRWCWACRARSQCSTSVSASRTAPPTRSATTPPCAAAYLGDDEAVEGTHDDETRAGSLRKR